MMICLPIVGKDIDDFFHKLDKADKLCDIIEIRFDLLKDKFAINPNEVKRKTNKPLIGTNRALWEGGACKAHDEERLDLLKEAVDAGFSFVDIEFNTKQSLINDFIGYAHQKGAKVILSYHDFDETKKGPFYVKLFEDMLYFKPDVIKIVTMAKTGLDFLSLTPLYQESNKLGQPLISFCMGEAGKYSRLLSLSLGAFLTFSCLDEEDATAPGQIPISKFKTILKLLN